MAHWIGVLTDWKKMIGADWNKTYAASNTIYVTRQNNILYSVLAQFFGPEAINSRLMLIETVSFTTTPEHMLELLTRIVADRSVGALFFGNYYLMDYELMGGNARAAIVAESAEARHDAVSASFGTVALQAMADVSYPGAGACDARRPSLTAAGRSSSILRFAFQQSPVAAHSASVAGIALSARHTAAEGPLGARRLRRFPMPAPKCSYREGMIQRPGSRVILSISTIIKCIRHKQTQRREHEDRSRRLSMRLPSATLDADPPHNT